MAGARAVLDAFVFSSVWLAAAAGSLVAAASAAMGAAIDPRAVGLACAGTLVIYNVDRLRDLSRDVLTSPERSAFVVRHRRPLMGLIAVAAPVAAWLAVAAGPPAALLLAPALAAGLAHRRLKRFAFVKPLYITAAWLAVSIGLPALLAGTVTHVAWAVAGLGAALLANAIASNVRDREAGAAVLGSARALAIARIVAASGALVLLAPSPARGLAAVPLATLVSLLAFRPGERYGLVAVDGALILGAALALALARSAS